MPRYFTREEAEALLPEISIVLRNIQESRAKIRAFQEEIEVLHTRAMGNGHHLHERITMLQKDLVTHIQALRAALEAVSAFGCVLKDQDSGLIDFLSLRDSREVYLCWQLGEERINYWHDLDTGFAGREPL